MNLNPVPCLDPRILSRSLVLNSQRSLRGLSTRESNGTVVVVVDSHMGLRLANTLTVGDSRGQSKVVVLPRTLEPLARKRVAAAPGAVLKYETLRRSILPLLKRIAPVVRHTKLAIVSVLRSVRVAVTIKAGAGPECSPGLLVSNREQLIIVLAPCSLFY